MENKLLTSVIAVILLLLAVYIGKLLRIILPSESITAHRKYIKLIRILLVTECAAYLINSIISTSATSFNASMITFLILSGLALIISMLLVIITKGNKWQYTAIGFFLLSAAYTGYCFNEKIASGLSFEVSVSKAQIKLRGSYTLDIPFSTISGIGLEHKFHDVAYRSNGISMNDKNIGYYILNNGEKCFLLLSNKSSPFIHIKRFRNIPVFINLATPEETKKLYKELSSSGKE